MQFRPRDPPSVAATAFGKIVRGLGLMGAGMATQTQSRLETRGLYYGDFSKGPFDE